MKIADKNKLYYGFKPDAVYVGGDSSHRVSVTVAIDKDSGTYAGYFALAPSSAVEDL